MTQRTKAILAEFEFKTAAGVPKTRIAADLEISVGYLNRVVNRYQKTKPPTKAGGTEQDKGLCTGDDTPNADGIRTNKDKA